MSHVAAPAAAPVAAPTGGDDYEYIGCFTLGDGDVLNFDDIEGSDAMTPTVRRANVCSTKENQ